MAFVNNTKRHIAVIDYGLGNLYSISRALDYINASYEITEDPKRIGSADAVILPGVGSFGDGMKGLRERGLCEAIRRFVESNKPLLGICLGMQLLMAEGEEFGRHEGLGIIKGRTAPLKSFVEAGTMYKFPHVGWNRIRFPKTASASWRDTILEGLGEEAFLYFVHSNVVALEDPALCLAETVYGGITFCSVVQKGNIYGCQFHPERSGQTGLNIYKKFIGG